MSTLPTRTIGPLTVSAFGLGCMPLSYGYGVPPSPEDGVALIRQALDAGVTFLDTAALYGAGRNEELVGRAIAGRRGEVVVASKGGMGLVDGVKTIDGRPETLRAHCDASLRRLGVDVIDLYYLHRWDKTVPIAESVGGLVDLMGAGKIRAIGLSEVSTTRLREAQQIAEIAAVQNEYSLWTRNPELGLVEACEQTGVALVPFSPLARGFLTGALPDPQAFESGDLRRGMPRFQPDHWPGNAALLPAWTALAAEAGCKPGQLALAWLLSRGERVVPIPGTTDPDHLDENLAAVHLTLSDDVLARADALVNHATVVGPRYSAAQSREVDADTFEEDA